MISGTDEYLDLSKTILVVEGSIKDSRGADLNTGQASVAPVNNFLHSLIKQVDVYLNGKQVTPAMGTYAYRSYLETLLNYDVSAKKSQLSSALYFKDTPGEMDESGTLPSRHNMTVSGGTTKTFMVAGTGNQGFAKRHEFITDSKKFVLSGPIFSDVFKCDRLLLNMVELKVVLNRPPNTFCLMDKNTSGNEVNPKVKLNDVVLKIQKVKVDEAVSTANELALKQTPALYPIRRVECKVLSIPPGLPNVRKDNIFSGIIPKSFVFGLMNAKNYNGEYGTNPYNFEHFGVKTVTLTVNGEEIPFKQLTLNYKDVDNIDYIQAYNTLFSGTGKMYANTGLDITREDYSKRYTLYAFDLTLLICVILQTILMRYSVDPYQLLLPSMLLKLMVKLSLLQWCAMEILKTLYALILKEM